MICEKCGKELSHDATLCTSCGWKSRKWEEGVKEGKQNNTILAVCLPLAVVLVLILIIALVISIAQG